MCDANVRDEFLMVHVETEDETGEAETRFIFAKSSARRKFGQNMQRSATRVFVFLLHLIQLSAYQLTLFANAFILHGVGVLHK